MEKSIYTKEYKDLLRRLQVAREEANLSQRQASTKLGQYITFVSKIETGERRIDVIELTHFAKLYEKPLSYFLPDQDL